jgi:Arc/MetJ family transcription regulator
MKNIALILLISIFCFSCNKEKKNRMQLDFDKVKSELQLTGAQEKQYDASVIAYNNDRKQQFEDLKSSGKGKGNKKAFKKIIKTSYQEQEAKMSSFLNANQASILHEYIKKNMPGQSDYSDELKQEVITTLSLDSIQTVKYKAVNDAFKKSFRDAHDHYHGNSEAANMYWNQFNDDRTAFLKKVFSEEQFQQYLKVVAKEDYRKKNNRE